MPAWEELWSGVLSLLYPVPNEIEAPSKHRVHVSKQDSLTGQRPRGSRFGPAGLEGKAFVRCVRKGSHSPARPNFPTGPLALSASSAWLFLSGIF